MTVGRPHRPEQQRRLRARIEFAWRAHQAQENWTAKVDIKATFILSLFTLVLGAGAFTISNGNGFPLALKGFHSFGLWQWTAIVGLGFTLVGAGLTVSAVIPRLKPGASPGIIYFGHVHRTDASVVRSQLDHLSESQMLSMLGDQLIAMSKVNWRKHRDLQWGMVVGSIGSLLVLVSLVFLRTA